MQLSVWRRNSWQVIFRGNKSVYNCTERTMDWLTQKPMGQEIFVKLIPLLWRLQACENDHCGISVYNCAHSFITKDVILTCICHFPGLIQLCVHLYFLFPLLRHLLRFSLPEKLHSMLSGSALLPLCLSWCRILVISYCSHLWNYYYIYFSATIFFNRCVKKIAQRTWRMG